MIPKIIHYCWLGPKPLPDSAKRNIESWRKYCPDYEIKKWTESDIDIKSVKYMEECYASKAWGFVPDVARLQIIYNEGGIYLDTDVELIKSLDPLLHNKAFMGFENDNIVNLGQGFGAESHNTLIKKFLDQYKNIKFINEDGTKNLIPSPEIQTEMLKKLGLHKSKEIQNVCSATIYPVEYFSGIDYYSGLSTRTEKTYSIHHFSGSWLSKDEKRMDMLRRQYFKKYGLKLGKILWTLKRVKIEKNKNGIKGIINKVGEKVIKL